MSIRLAALVIDCVATPPHESTELIELAVQVFSEEIGREALAVKA